MFNCSSEVKWIRVTDIDSGLAWINLENVERIYPISDGSATGGYGSLKNLYYETHVSGERKVKADVVIEGEAK